MATHDSEPLLYHDTLTQKQKWFSIFKLFFLLYPLCLCFEYHILVIKNGPSFHLLYNLIRASCRWDSL